MKRKPFQRMSRLWLLVLLCHHFLGLPSVYSQTVMANGIQPLIELERQTLHDLISLPIQALFFPHEMEHFLQKLEGAPPDWTQLRHTDITEQSTRLFNWNRQQDSARTDKNGLLQQPVAFLWTGLLRHYLPEFQGFSVALGPEYTNTSWGIIRFKPANLPDYLVAVPSGDLRKQLLARQKHGEEIEITVLCIGSLISEESLIYGFSHDGHHEGMILPVVALRSLKYILKPS